jgi:glutamine synthetase
MIDSRKKANEISDHQNKAMEYSKQVLTKMDPIRYHCDKLELLVDNTLWPLAKYRELLFSC